jgi:hypothetical protein
MYRNRLACRNCKQEELTCCKSDLQQRGQPQGLQAPLEFRSSKLVTADTRALFSQARLTEPSSWSWSPHCPGHARCCHVERPSTPAPAAAAGRGGCCRGGCSPGWPVPPAARLQQGAHVHVCPHWLLQAAHHRQGAHVSAQAVTGRPHSSTLRTVWKQSA